VMHPDGRVSPLQERQMTSVLDPNVYNLAVRGTFDDCQALMKSIFSDADFKARYSLGAVNSVNWARVLAQIVYYFYAAFRVMKATGADSVQFAVPTGNFGDILAGWYAMKMGLPIRRLILATNENDILHRFFTTGEYAVGETVPTLSPSMDIQIASNFERYLYYRLGEDAAAVRARMEAFRATGSLDAPPSSGAPDIVAGRGDTDETLKTIRLFADETGLILDPHTAVGVHVAQSFLEPDSPTICLATAHPAKFSDAIRRATGQEAIHPILEAIRRAPTRQDRIEADEAAIRAYLAERIAGDASA
jgi:threonine synthase